MPDLSLVHAREAVPLTQTGLAPLVRHIEEQCSRSITRAQAHALLRHVPPKHALEPAGRLLLLRFTDMMQAPAVPRVAPLLPAGKPVTARDAQRETRIRCAP